MKNKSLVFIPTGLNSPELEILVASAQELINNKKKVTIVTCRGGKYYRCIKNLFSISSVCHLCKLRRNNLIQKIEGDFEILETPILKKKKRIIKNNFKLLKKYSYKKIDNGLAAYSSYLEITRDKDLNGRFSQNIISGLINTSNQLTDFYLNLLKTRTFKEVTCYNSRMNLYRPLFRASVKYNLKLNNLESFHNDKKLIIQNLKNALANDYDQLPKLIDHYWKLDCTKKKYKKASIFYKKIQTFTSRMENSKNFILDQKKNLLPNNWDQQKFNITYFASSEDEYESIIKKNDDSIFKNQLDSIINVIKIIKDKKDFFLYVRMHPNLSNVNWSYVTDINDLDGRFNNVSIIKANSLISSHALIKYSDLILGLRSRTLLEATYINKPTIILGRSYWDELGPFLKIKNITQLRKLILSKKVKFYGKLAALKYAYFWFTYGRVLKDINGNYKFSKNKKITYTDFRYKNFKNKFSILHLIIYYFLKLIERILLYLNYALSKKV